MAQVNQDKKIVVVGDQLLSIGLEIAGVKEVYIPNYGEGVEALLNKLFSRADVGVLVISEGIVEGIKDRRLLNKIENSISPVVMEIPGYGEKEKRTDTLRRMVMRAVGIDITNTGKAKK